MNEMTKTVHRALARGGRRLAMAAALAVVLLGVGWLAGDVTPAHAQEVVITKTVGTSVSGCPASRAITVTLGASVNYCFTIHNTGTLSFTQYVYSDSLLRRTFTTTVEGGVFAPGSVVVRTNAQFPELGPVRPLASVTNTVYLTATAVGGAIVTAQSSARVHVTPPDPINAAVLITKTVGLTPGVCATGKQLVVNRGVPVYYCFTVTNVGNVPFTRYEYNDAQLQVSGATTVWEFWPGSVITRTNSVFSQLGPFTPTVSLTNTVSVDADGPYGPAFAIDRAQVTVIQPPPAPAIVVTKTVGVESAICADAENVEVAASTPVFFCISVQNTGNIDLTRVIVYDTLATVPPLSATITRTVNLAPGGVVTFTHTMQGLSFLGNIVQTADFTNTVDVLAVGPFGQATGRATSSVAVLPAQKRVYLPTIQR